MIALNNLYFKSLASIITEQSPVKARVLADLFLNRDDGEAVDVVGILVLLSHFSASRPEDWAFLQEHEEWICLHLNIDPHHDLEPLLPETGYRQAGLFLRDIGMNRLLDALLRESSAASWRHTHEHFFRLNEWFGFDPSTEDLRKRMVNGLRADGCGADAMAAVCWWGCRSLPFGLQNEPYFKYHGEMLVDIFKLFDQYPFTREAKEEIIDTYFLNTSDDCIEESLSRLMLGGVPRDTLLISRKLRRRLLCVDLDI